eukprot:2423114-Pyramimonas_sp.AAC.1
MTSLSRCALGFLAGSRRHVFATLVVGAGAVGGERSLHKARAEGVPRVVALDRVGSAGHAEPVDCAS